MKSKVFALSLVLLLLAACAPAAARGTFEAGQMELHPGQILDDVQSGSILTFVEIVQDSRCPADATCVTSGFVQVLLKIEQGEITRDEILTLGDLAEGDVNSIGVGGWTVTLVEVNPYPLASQPVDLADYTITLDFQAE
jgi:hypothetical protein